MVESAQVGLITDRFLTGGIGQRLLRSNITDWTDQQLWKAYIQLTQADIDQSWRLSRIRGVVAGWGDGGWKATPWGRRGSYGLQRGDLSGIRMHQFGAAGCGLHQAAA